MKPLMTGKDHVTGEEIIVDPNEVLLNEAGTNMLVATYSEKEWDRGNREPEYKNYARVRLNEKDHGILLEVFKEKRRKLTAKKKKEKIKIQKAQKEKLNQKLIA